MRYLIKLERKRILNKKTIIILIAIFLIFSIMEIRNPIRRYRSTNNKFENISGYEYLNLLKKDYSTEVLKTEKLLEVVERYREIDIDDNKDSIEEKDLPIIKLISMNYKGKDLSNIYKNDIDNFHMQRISRIKKILDDDTNNKYRSKEKNDLLVKASELKSPIAIGYSEGWKNLNKYIQRFIRIIIMIIGFILVPIYTEDIDINMRDLINSTKYGKERLNKIRLISAIEITTTIYLLGILIYTTILFFLYGIRGGSLPIQSFNEGFFSIYNINFLQQFIINIVVGYIAMLLMMSFSLLFSSMVDQIIAGYVGIVTVLTLTIILEFFDDFKLNHNIGNFLPLRMVEFVRYYRENEIYRIFGYPILSLKYILIIAILLIIILNFLVIKIADRRNNCNYS